LSAGSSRDSGVAELRPPRSGGRAAAAADRRHTARWEQLAPVGAVNGSAEPALARARTAWKQAGLDPVGLHEARHTCASVMIAAGVSIKALSEFLGHSSITITLDRYGHLLPGSIAEAAKLLDTFLALRGTQWGTRDEKSLQIDE
jgi:integrase